MTSPSDRPYHRHEEGNGTPVDVWYRSGGSNQQWTRS
ncbi:hypothetical protein RKD20_009339 [Streptomyces sp. SLBN-8D4]